MVVIMRYAVRYTIYGEGGETISRGEKLFRLRKKAEEYKVNLRKRHDEDDTVSLIEIIKLDTGVVVQTAKSKKLKKEQRRRR